MRPIGWWKLVWIWAILFGSVKGLPTPLLNRFQSEISRYDDSLIGFHRINPDGVCPTFYSNSLDSRSVRMGHERSRILEYVNYINSLRSLLETDYVKMRHAYGDSKGKRQDNLRESIAVNAIESLEDLAHQHETLVHDEDESVHKDEAKPTIIRTPLRDNSPAIRYSKPLDPSLCQGNRTENLLRRKKGEISPTVMSKILNRTMFKRESSDDLETIRTKYKLENKKNQYKESYKDLLCRLVSRKTSKRKKIIDDDTTTSPKGSKEHDSSLDDDENEIISRKVWWRSNKTPSVKTTISMKELKTPVMLASTSRMPKTHTTEYKNLKLQEKKTQAPKTQTSKLHESKTQGPVLLKSHESKHEIKTQVPEHNASRKPESKTHVPEHQALKQESKTQHPEHQATKTQSPVLKVSKVPESKTRAPEHPMKISKQYESKTSHTEHPVAKQRDLKTQASVLKVSKVPESKTKAPEHQVKISKQHESKTQHPVTKPPELKTQFSEHKVTKMPELKARIPEYKDFKTTESKTQHLEVKTSKLLEQGTLGPAKLHEPKTQGPKPILDRKSSKDSNEPVASEDDTTKISRKQASSNTKRKRKNKRRKNKIMLTSELFAESTTQYQKITQPREGLFKSVVTTKYSNKSSTSKGISFNKAVSASSSSVSSAEFTTRENTIHRMAYNSTNSFNDSTSFETSGGTTSEIASTRKSLSANNNLLTSIPEEDSRMTESSTGKEHTTVNSESALLSIHTTNKEKEDKVDTTSSAIIDGKVLLTSGSPVETTLTQNISSQPREEYSTKTGESSFSSTCLTDIKSTTPFITSKLSTENTIESQIVMPSNNIIKTPYNAHDINQNTNLTHTESGGLAKCLFKFPQPIYITGMTLCGAVNQSQLENSNKTNNPDKTANLVLVLSAFNNDSIRTSSEQSFIPEGLKTTTEFLLSTSTNSTGLLVRNISEFRKMYNFLQATYPSLTISDIQDSDLHKYIKQNGQIDHRLKNYKYILNKLNSLEYDALLHPPVDMKPETVLKPGSSGDSQKFSPSNVGHADEFIANLISVIKNSKSKASCIQAESTCGHPNNMNNIEINPNVVESSVEKKNRKRRSAKDYSAFRPLIIPQDDKVQDIEIPNLKTFRNGTIDFSNRTPFVSIVNNPVKTIPGRVSQNNFQHNSPYLVPEPNSMNFSPNRSHPRIFFQKVPRPESNLKTYKMPLNEKEVGRILYVTEKQDTTPEINPCYVEKFQNLKIQLAPYFQPTVPYPGRPVEYVPFQRILSSKQRKYQNYGINHLFNKYWKK